MPGAPASPPLQSGSLEPPWPPAAVPPAPVLVEVELVELVEPPEPPMPPMPPQPPQPPVVPPPLVDPDPPEAVESRTTSGSPEQLRAVTPSATNDHPIKRPTLTTLSSFLPTVSRTSRSQGLAPECSILNASQFPPHRPRKQGLLLQTFAWSGKTSPRTSQKILHSRGHLERPFYVRVDRPERQTGQPRLGGPVTKASPPCVAPSLLLDPQPRCSITLFPIRVAEPAGGAIATDHTLGSILLPALLQPGPLART